MMKTAHLKVLLLVLLIIFRYIAAVVVAFVASIVTLSHLPDLFEARTVNADSPFWDFIWFSCTGLAGVAAGSICLPRKHRWIGSLFLLILGLGFTLLIFGSMSEDDLGSFDLFPLLSVGVGGIIPVAVSFLWERKQNQVWPNLKRWISSYP